MRKSTAKKILSLNDQWNRTDKETIAKKVESALINRNPALSDPGAMVNEIMRITGSTRHTVYAWFNKSRENVKIPFIKLCKLANELHVSVKDLM